MRSGDGVAAKPGNKTPTFASESGNCYPHFLQALRLPLERDRAHAWREENFDEFFRVPRINEPKINVHRAVHGSLVSREQAFCLARVIEHFVQSVRAYFAAEHRKKNAAAENRIDKSGGVACKQPAIAVQTRASIGEIRFDIDLRDALRFCHAFRNAWLFRQCLLEKIVSAELGFTKSFAVENYSDARSLIVSGISQNQRSTARIKTVSVPSIPSGRHTPS